MSQIEIFFGLVERRLIRGGDHAFIQELKESIRRFVEQCNVTAGPYNRFHVTIDPETGDKIPVLYHFWVKTVTTPEGETIPLFSDYVFARNASPTRHPEAQILCPRCWSILEERYDSRRVTCPSCGHAFDP